MKESLQNIGELIAEPSGTFTRLKSQPRWGIAFLIFYVVSVFMVWAILPYSEVLMTSQFTQNDLQPEQIEAAKNMARIMMNVMVFILPVFAILFLIVGSALLKLVARWILKNDTLRFRHIYAAVIHISLIGCVIQLVNTALLLVFRDVGDVTSAADLKMIPGLHLLFGEGVAPKLAILLSHINPLSLWLIVVMAIAVSILADVEKTRARITAVILWGISILPEVISAT